MLGTAPAVGMGRLEPVGGEVPAAVDLGEAGSVTAAAAVAEEAAGLAVAAVAAVDSAACAPMGGETTRARSAQ